MQLVIFESFLRCTFHVLSTQHQVVPESDDGLSMILKVHPRVWVHGTMTWANTENLTFILVPHRIYRTSHGAMMVLINTDIVVRAFKWAVDHDPNPRSHSKSKHTEFSTKPWIYDFSQTTPLLDTEEYGEQTPILLAVGQFHALCICPRKSSGQRPIPLKIYSEGHCYLKFR